jgi:hypothetical protein
MKLASLRVNLKFMIILPGLSGAFSLAFFARRGRHLARCAASGLNLSIIGLKVDFTAAK